MTIFFQEGFDTYPPGNVTLNSDWRSRGYVDWENSGHPGSLKILTRDKLPLALINDPRFPKAKTHALQVNLSANEVIARLTWAKYPPGTRLISQSQWQYRTRVGGEKVVRQGNFINGDVNQNRLVDAIWTLGHVTGLTLEANSTQQFPSVDYGFGPIPGFPPGLRHLESVMCLSSADNADGWAEFYVDGTRVARVDNYRYFKNAADARIGWQISELGGWSSTGGRTEGRVSYPIKYHVCAWRLADCYQGMWPMDSA